MYWTCVDDGMPKSNFDKVLVAYYDSRDVEINIKYGVARSDIDGNWGFECLNDDPEKGFCSSSKHSMSYMGFRVLYWMEIPNCSETKNHI